MATTTNTTTEYEIDGKKVTEHVREGDLFESGRDDALRYALMFHGATDEVHQVKADLTTADVIKTAKVFLKFLQG